MSCGGGGGGGGDVCVWRCCVALLCVVLLVVVVLLALDLRSAHCVALLVALLCVVVLLCVVLLVVVVLLALDLHQPFAWCCWRLACDQPIAVSPLRCAALQCCWCCWRYRPNQASLCAVSPSRPFLGRSRPACVS